MRFLLTAKHWQVFLILMVGMLMSNFSMEGQVTLTLAINILGSLIYFLWPMLIVYGLVDYLPKKIALNDTFFFINGFISLGAVLGTLIISNGQGVTFTGIAALLMLYIVYAFSHYLSFPGKALKTIENKKQAVLSEYIFDFFLIVLLPIGIWLLQPRINKIVEEGDKET